MLLLIALIAAQPIAEVVVKDPDPVVCVRQKVGSEVGTHMQPKKRCMRKSEWQLVEQQTKEEMQKFRDRAAFDPGRGGVPR